MGLQELWREGLDHTSNEHAKRQREASRQSKIVRNLLSSLFPDDKVLNAVHNEYYYNDICAGLRHYDQAQQREFFAQTFREIGAENWEEIADLLVTLNNIVWFSPKQKSESQTLEASVRKYLSLSSSFFTPDLPVRVIKGEWAEMDRIEQKRLIGSERWMRDRDSYLTRSPIEQAAMSFVLGAVLSPALDATSRKGSQWAAANDAVVDAEFAMHSLFGGNHLSGDSSHRVLVDEIYTKGYWPFGSLVKTEGLFKKRNVVREFIIFEPPTL